MDRNDRAADARDEQLAQLIEKLYLNSMTLLRMGDPSSAAEVGNLLSAEFRNSALMEQLVVLAASDERQAGALLTDLVKKAMRAEAEKGARQQTLASAAINSTN